MKFIGHLDMMRYFQKAIRRAGINIAYSEGYSPHQIMSFAAPLGVGVTSDGEYFDIEVRSTQSSLCSIRALNETMVEGISILEYKRLPDTAKTSMSLVAITFSSWRSLRYSEQGIMPTAQSRTTSFSMITTKQATAKSIISTALRGRPCGCGSVPPTTAALAVSAKSAAAAPAAPAVPRGRRRWRPALLSNPPQSIPDKSRPRQRAVPDRGTGAGERRKNHGRVSAREIF